HGAILKCQGKVPDPNAPNAPIPTLVRCPVQFPSYSVVRLIRKQAQLAGWGRVPTWHITGDRGDGTQAGDACPEHHEIAKLNAQQAAQLIRTQKDAEKAQRKAARDAAKAERDRIKAARVAKWAAQKEEWARRRADKAKRKQQRSEAVALKSAAAALKADGAATKIKQQSETAVRKKRGREASAAQARGAADRAARIAGAKALVEGTKTPPERT